MKINFISCKNREEELEIIKLLKEKYRNNINCKFREISETFILPDKKWIVASELLTKQLTKRKPEVKIYSAEVIRCALLKH